MHTAFETMEAHIARHLVIRGRVQGVGFRAAMVDEARGLGVAGWVRNRPDGSVEAFVAGAVPDVERLVAWARRGPGGACVEAVEIAERERTAFDATGFEWRPTG